MGLDIPGQNEKKKSQGFIGSELFKTGHFMSSIGSSDQILWTQIQTSEAKRLGVLIPTWFRSTSHSPHSGIQGPRSFVCGLTGAGPKKIYKLNHQDVSMRMVSNLLMSTCCLDYLRGFGPFHVVRILNNIRT